MMRAGILRITPELLLGALNLPEGVRIVNVSLDFSTSLIYFWIEHHSLPETPIGSVIPFVRADYRTHVEAPKERIEFVGFR